MSPEQTNLLTLRRLPARLTLEQAADYMGFNPGDVPILMAAKLLKPLGHPAANGQKYFSSAELDRLRNDVEWLGRASDALSLDLHLPAGTVNTHIFELMTLTQTPACSLPATCFELAAGCWARMRFLCRAIGARKHSP
jgi:hypothetical protein